MTAGQLRERVAFFSREAQSDGAGNEEGEWVQAFVVAAELRPLQGSETVMAKRLDGIQPYVIIVRESSLTSQVTTDWMARDVRSGREFNITAIKNGDQKGAYLEMMAVHGRAVG